MLNQSHLFYKHDQHWSTEVAVWLTEVVDWSTEVSVWSTEVAVWSTEVVRSTELFDQRKLLFDLWKLLFDLRKLLFDLRKLLFDLWKLLFDLQKLLCDPQTFLSDQRKLSFNLGKLSFDLRKSLFDRRKLLFDLRKLLFDLRNLLFDPRKLLLASVSQLKPWGSSNAGWESSVCNLYPTPEHSVKHTNAVMPVTLAAVPRLRGRRQKWIQSVFDGSFDGFWFLLVQGFPAAPGSWTVIDHFWEEHFQWLTGRYFSRWICYSHMGKPAIPGNVWNFLSFQEIAFWSGVSGSAQKF